ncbi:hypothetical protein [Salinivibrio socompensis]|nr:hypothetical protein [Salinivibrio socompensis]
MTTSTYPNTVLTHVGSGKAFGEPFVVMAGFGDQMMEGQRPWMLTQCTGR